MKYLYIGLSVAYLSGKRSANSQPFGAYNQDDIDSLRALIEEPGIVDIFLTYPFYMLNGVNGHSLSLSCPSFDSISLVIIAIYDFLFSFTGFH